MEDFGELGRRFPQRGRSESMTEVYSRKEREEKMWREQIKRAL